MPTNPLTADRRRLQKGIDTAQALCDRQDQCYVQFEITRLLSVKSLCRPPGLALRFMAYLADLTAARAAAQASPNLPLITQAAEALNRQARQPSATSLGLLRTLFTQAQDVQNEYQRIYGQPVRLIHDEALWLVASTLRGALEPALAAECAYRAVRCHGKRRVRGLELPA